MKHYTAEEVRGRLVEAVAKAGSAQAYARQHKVSGSYVRDVLRGHREPGQGILDTLGLEKVTVYAHRRVK